MNTYITLACLLAVAGVSHSNPVGYGLGGGLISPIIVPSAISTANLVKAAPISVIRTAAVAPIIAPAVRTVPILKTVGVGNLGLGLGGLGLGGLGWGGLGYGGLGWGGYGHGGLGWGHGGKIYG